MQRGRGESVGAAERGRASAEHLCGRRGQDARNLMERRLALAQLDKKSLPLFFLATAGPRGPKLPREL